jgi:hypothetical protein
MIKLRLLFILCFVFTVSGCAGFVPKVATVPPSELKVPRNITLIPYKARPMLVNVNHGQAAANIGPLSVLAYRAATAEERGKIADSLNKSVGSWDPSFAAAEECLNILKSNSKVPIVNLSISNLGELPGSEDLHGKFTANFTDSVTSGDWGKVMRNFSDTNNSLIKYKKEHPEMKSDWSLEVFCNVIGFNDSAIGAHIYMKVMDTTKNDMIAAGSVSDSCPISGMPDSFDAFKQIWRPLSQKLCTKALSDMGLIAK